MSLTSRLFLLGLIALSAAPGGLAAADTPARKPNFILVLADDMGWRDTGYNGNKIVKTPHLDEMAAKGLRFDYFYPGGQMCSPGRHALMTGRNPLRAGIHHLQATRPQEIIIPRALKQAGYRSALFGKWHLGNKETSPVRMGFDQAHWTPNFFDIGARFRVNDTETFVETRGDSSVAVMELALDYIRKQAKESHPFFAYVCFGSPHAPHQAAPEFKALYKDLPDKQGKKTPGADFWGEISGLDAAVGNLRAELRKLAIADDTLVWFTSDNGGITPQSMDPTGRGKYSIGCRVPALIEWPARVPKPVQTTVPCGHVDVYPTLLDLAGVKVEKQPVLDGISLVPLLDGKLDVRPKPLGFLLWNGKQGKQFAEADFIKDLEGVWIDGKYKLIVNRAGKRAKAGAPVALYDIFADPAEKTNLADKHPEVVTRMRQALEEWQRSVRASYDGKDFAKP